MARYKSDGGVYCEGELFTDKMKDGICVEYKRPYINTEGKRLYPSKDDYVFVIDGETRKRTLTKEVFESVTTEI